MSRVHIGTIGWNFPAWDQGYFPNDIPEDWKLAFYANDFSAVALPESLWAGESLESVCQQLDELEPGFAVYCLAQSQMPSVEMIRQVKSVMGDFFAGFIVSENVDVEAMSQYQKDFVFSADCFIPGNDEIRYWGTLPIGNNSKLSVIKLDGETDLKILRQQFASVQSQLDDKADVFVMVSSGSSGGEPDVAFLQQLRTLLELMAIA